MPEVTIRAAVLEDLPTLLRCEQAIVEAERPFDPTLRPSGVRYYDIEAILCSPDARFAVAEARGEIIACGFASIQPAKSYLSHGQQAYLGLMYVAPVFRGRGVNQLVIDDLKQWCRTRNVNELRLDVYATNQAALRAYEKAGFEGLLLQMRLGLDPKP